MPFLSKIVLFIVFILVVMLVLTLVMGLLGFIGLCLLVGSAFIMFTSHGKVQMKGAFGILLIVGLLLVVSSYFGLDIYNPEVANIQNQVKDLVSVLGL